MLLKTEFKDRFKQACDDSSLVPGYGQGRQSFIAGRLKIRQEAVRKWFAGEARPKPDKMRALANLLEVDEAWLSLGITPEVDRKDKRAHGVKTDGAVHLLYGMFTMSGGMCAFPSENDPRRDAVDFYAIRGGVQYAIHVAVARETSKNVYEFFIPHQYQDVRLVGIIPVAAMRYHLVDLKSGLVDRHKQKKAGQFAIIMHRKGNEYATGADTWPRLNEMGELQ